MKLRLIVLLAVVVNILGCAAALVPTTSDPAKQLEYAYDLINAGRPLPAERLAKEALARFESVSDNSGAGRAYRVLGILYQSSAYRSFEKFYREQGTYDPTYGTSIANFKHSAESFRKAGDLWGASAGLVGVGDGYMNQGDRQEGCAAYREASVTYNDPAAVFTGLIHTWNPKYKTYAEMLDALIAGACGPGPTPAPRMVVVQIGGDETQTSSGDWPTLVEDWKTSMKSATASAGMDLIFLHQAELLPMDSATLVKVTVNDFRYMSQGKRWLYGGLAGNAFMDVIVEFSELPSKNPIGIRKYSTSTRFREGGSSPASPAQIESVSKAIVSELRLGTHRR